MIPENRCSRILIVDDEPEIVKVLKFHLEDNGFETGSAGDGLEALEILTRESFSLLLLDVKMPRITGIEILPRIHDAYPDMAVIMMTAHGSEDLAVECMRAGAVDYFPKPFSLDDMLHRVNSALSSRRIFMEKLRLEKEKLSFFSMLSHDLKNPITAVIGSIDIVREGRLGPLNSEQADYLQSAIDSCNEVVTMIDNLLDIQRLESGATKFHISDHDPAEIAAEVAGRFRHTAEHDGLNLSIDMHTGISEASIDRNVFRRIIANLLTNAVKFTPEGGTVNISCGLISMESAVAILPENCLRPSSFTGRQSCVRLCVSDTGNGIPAEDLNRIFERYIQSGNASGRGGAGLGLAFCKMAVTEMGGIIWATSTIGRGSDFIMLFPCTSEMEGNK